MHVTQSEEEEIEQLKGWLRDYGPSFLIGVVLALAIGFGWNWWKERQVRIAQAASSEYSQLLKDISRTRFTRARNKATDLMTEYEGTPYAAWAAISVAKIDVTEKALDDAQEKLEWAIEHTKNESLKQTARIRLAKVLIAKNDPKRALVILNTMHDDTFQGLVFDAKGDAYVAIGDRAEAKQAFESAIEYLSKQGIQPPAFLTMKLQNVDSIKG
jgi:predicted negative regulator of RcsB-dependent stress response